MREPLLKQVAHRREVRPPGPIQVCELALSAFAGERLLRSWSSKSRASAPAADPSVIHTVAPLALQGYTPTSWTAAADGAEPPGTPADVTAWVVCAAP